MALDEQERSFVGRLSGKIERACVTSGRTGRTKTGGSKPASQGSARDARQRVVVKVSYVKMSTAQGASKARAHLSYLERDGVAQDGNPGKLFNEHGEVERAEFWKRSEGDPHQFRIIISPEQGHKMDLEQFAKSFVNNLECKTRHKLDWCAVAHYNTDHPHVHVIVRGSAMSGKQVRFSREMISNGMREYAQDRATMELGERTRAQHYEQQRREVQQNGYTTLDRMLERVADESRRVKLNEGILDRDGELRHNAVLRLKHLEQLQLVERAGRDQWQLAPDFKERLQAHQRDMDMHKRLIEAKCNPLTAERCALEPGKEVSGKVLMRGLADEARGTEYMVIIQKNGCARYIELERERERERAQVGDVVTVQRAQDGKMDVRTHGTIERQIHAPVVTWLDRQTPGEVMSASFTRELNQGLRARREELERSGVLKQGEPSPAPDELSRRLARMEFERWVIAERAQRSAAGQRPLELARDVTRFEGRVREEPVQLHASKFLVIEGRTHDVLVPLSKEIWALRGQRVEGSWERDEQAGRPRLAVRVARENEVER